MSTTKILAGEMNVQNANADAPVHNVPTCPITHQDTVGFFVILPSLQNGQHDTSFAQKNEGT